MGRPLGREQVTIIRAEFVENSRDGSKERDWANATRTTYKGCNVQPFILSEKFQSEDTKDREFARWTLRVWGPASMDVQYTDRVEWRGTVYEALGLIQVWSHLMGPDNHVSFAMRDRVG